MTTRRARWYHQINQGGTQYTPTAGGWTFGRWTYTVVDKPDVTQRHTDNETVDETAPLCYDDTTKTT